MPQKYKARKSLGQHFLINPALCAKIADLLDPVNGDNIIEIGPGPGALTSYLQKKAYKTLLLLEKDKHFARERARASCFTINMDALRFDWHKLGHTGKWKIIGNLPYNVASPLIWDIVSQCSSLEKAVFMVQKEVGERLVAKPDSRDYGALSVWTQCHVTPHLEFNVKAGSFNPPPRVESAVLSFLPVPVRPEFPGLLKLVLNVFFQNRRKQLGGILKKNNWLKFQPVFEHLGIDLRLRPENITCKTYLELVKGFNDFKSDNISF